MDLNKRLHGKITRPEIKENSSKLCFASKIKMNFLLSVQLNDYIVLNCRAVARRPVISGFTDD